MKTPDPNTLFEAVDATWPAAQTRADGPWTLRRGAGGGSRVSAATLNGVAGESDIRVAEDTMMRWGQDKLFMIRPEDAALDTTLENNGYQIKDPVVVLAAPIETVAQYRPKTLSSFAIETPLACQTEIWALGGIGQPRLDVMDRCSVAKTTLLGRRSDTPAGSGFVAVSNNIAMLHALEVTETFRRTGLGRDLTVSAAYWAQNQGALWMTLLVTRANKGAIALYSSLGMTAVGQYHYRIKP